MSAKLHWTAEMDAALRQGMDRREAYWRIAEDIGVGEGTARNRANELGWKRPPPPMSRARPHPATRINRELMFADMLADGASPQEAADQCDYVSGNAVLQRIRAKLGWQAV